MESAFNENGLYGSNPVPYAFNQVMFFNIAGNLFSGINPTGLSGPGWTAAGNGIFGSASGPAITNLNLTLSFVAPDGGPQT